MDKKFNFQELQAIVATLRGENGCPWDKSQTHESLKLYTLEEAYEVNQAVSNLTKTGDCTNLKEELGDLLFQVLLQSQVAEDNGEFAIEDVIDGIARKMIHRHPHVFAGRHYDSVEQQQADWEKLKTQEEGHKQTSLKEDIDLIPENFPALIRGEKVAKRLPLPVYFPPTMKMYSKIFSLPSSICSSAPPAKTLKRSSTAMKNFPKS